MSRIGKLPIKIPENVSITQENEFSKIRGPLGEIEVKVHPFLRCEITDGILEIKPRNNSKLARSVHGTTRALIANAVEGVVNGFKKQLEVVGIGYRAQVEEESLILKIGFSHDVKVKAPEGIKFSVRKNQITIEGIDKQSVGETAAKIRSLKKPEPYKGKGIKYIDEKIIRKVGKTVKSTTGS